MEEVDIMIDRLPRLYMKAGGDVPLRGIVVKGRVVGFMADVEVQQRYMNTTQGNVEAVYCGLFVLMVGLSLSIMMLR